MGGYIGGSLMDVTGRSPGMAFEIDEKQLKRLVGKLDKLRGKTLYFKLQRSTLYAADLLVPKIKAATPVGPGHYIEGSQASGGRRSKPGFLRRSVRARTAKKRFGNSLVPTLGALVGPTAPHRHLVIRGTQGHSVYSKQGKAYGSFAAGQVRRFPFEHPGSRPNPFVDRAASGYEHKAAEIVKKAWFGDWSNI